MSKEIRALANYTEEEREVARNLARQDFYFFVRWMFLNINGNPWKKGDHHKRICDALMKVYNGEIKRLVINIAPRYSKTELAVVYFTAFCMGHKPDSEFIHASYSATLAEGNSVNIRNVVSHPEYAKIFPNMELASDSKARADWKTTNGGRFYATGFGGTLIGIGAGKMREGFGGAFIIDDPIKASEAHSEKIRDSVIDDFKSSVKSRLNAPWTPMILIMQRLHENDLAGWVLAGNDDEEWESLIIPSRNPDGSPLWPFKHSAKMLDALEKADEYGFSCQHLQRPAPPEGGMFKADRITIVDIVPSGILRMCRGWDLAASDVVKADWTVGSLFAALEDGRTLIMDVDRFKGGPHEVEKSILDHASQDGVNVQISIPQDPGQAGKTQAKFTGSKLSGYNVIFGVTSGSKQVNASPFASQVNLGNVLMMRGSWNQTLIDELKLFPNGKDDQVDSCAQAFNRLYNTNMGIFDFIRSQLTEEQLAIINANEVLNAKPS